MAKRELGRIVSGGSTEVIFRDNSKEILAALDDTGTRILTMIGLKAVAYAKKLCPVGTSKSTKKKGHRGGTLRGSLTFVVEGKVLRVGSNVDYAPYVELGTGPYFEELYATPKWMEHATKKGKGIGRVYVHQRPYLRPALEDHADEYARMSQSELKG